MTSALKEMLPKVCYGAAVAGAVFLGLPGDSSMTLNGLISVCKTQNLAFTVATTSFVRLLLSTLRDEVFVSQAPRSRDDVLEEVDRQMSRRPIVSNRSLLLSSLFISLSILIDPTLCLTVAASTFGWELAGILYNSLSRFYSS